MMSSAAPLRVEVPLFPAGHRMAFTSSWDDGTIHDRRLAPALRDLGMKGTFHLNSGFLRRPGQEHAGTGMAPYIETAEVAALYAGHEVAGHTLTHPWLDRLDAAQVAQEVLEDRKNLEDLVGYPVRGMAYPYGAYNRRVMEVLRAVGVVYARTVESRGNPWVPDEPLAWPATCSVLKEGWTQDFLSWYDRGGQGLYFVWGHSYEFEGKGRGGRGNAAIMRRRRIFGASPRRGA
jgi:peptidoglycan-N-acetylglucosamine deacetylase